jgi:hypothetical protein
MTSTPNAGAETDQHITGSPETDEFPTDAPPAGGAEAHGSSNKGINDRRGNRNEGEDDETVPEPPD